MQQLDYLLGRYLEGTAGPEELENFFGMVLNRSSHAELEKALQKYWMMHPDQEREYFMHKKEDEVLYELFNNNPVIRPVRRLHFLKTALFRYAAIFLLLAGTAIYLYTSSFRGNPEVTRQQQTSNSQDIPPGGNKAILTLSDGSTIVLDSAANGALAQQGNTKIIKLDAGSLAYNNGSTLSGEIGTNTISTPKGGQYQVTLPDGTKVWLNAASSIRFPTAFVKERKVAITGEVYFEVKASPNLPFTVSVSGTSVNVLGTSFNVNAYEDEKAMQTTLIEGSIKVVRGKEGLILRPGQQARTTQVAGQSRIDLIENVHLEKVMAWKNGLFNFENVPLEELMRQLARWYDIEVVYEKGAPDIHFVGEMSRNVSLEGLFKGLERGGVHFRKEGKKITILP